MSDAETGEFAIVRSYATPDLAKQDQEKLAAGGVDASLSSESGAYSFGSAVVELRVPQSQADQANQILGPPTTLDDVSTDELEEPDPELTCPLCRTGDPRPLPPYVVFIAVPFIGAMLALITREIVSAAWGFPILLAGLIALAKYAGKLPKWQCKACGTRWGDVPRPPLPD